MPIPGSLGSDDSRKQGEKRTAENPHVKLTSKYYIACPVRSRSKHPKTNGRRKTASHNIFKQDKIISPVTLEKDLIPFVRQRLATLLVQLLAFIAAVIFGAWAIKSYNAAVLANKLSEQSYRMSEQSYNAAVQANTLSYSAYNATLQSNALSEMSGSQSFLANKLLLLSICLQAPVSTGLSRAKLKNTMNDL